MLQPVDNNTARPRINNINFLITVETGVDASLMLTVNRSEVWYAYNN